MPDGNVWNLLLEPEEKRESAHYLEANSLLSGDLYLQQKLAHSHDKAPRQAHDATDDHPRL